MAGIKYPNFAAEMARTQTDYGEVYEKTSDAVGKSVNTIQNWIIGRNGELTVKAAFFIRDTFFPGLPVSYLFDEKPKVITK
jgi:hypothetical protein